MKLIHAWILAPTYKEESHHLFMCRTRLGFFMKMLHAKMLYDYIEAKNDTDWIAGVFPSKSGNYVVRYKGKESRGIFTTFYQYWEINGLHVYSESVEWIPGSYRK